MGASSYLSNELLDHVFKVGSFAQPTNLAISLHTADPGLTGASEVANANGYARVVHNAWDIAAAQATENTGIVTFAQATGSWGTVTYVGVWDSATYGGGNFLGGGALTESKAINNGDTAEFADGALDVSMS